jgi:hypothetical protein
LTHWEGSHSDKRIWLVVRAVIRSRWARLRVLARSTSMKE